MTDAKTLPEDLSGAIIHKRSFSFWVQKVNRRGILVCNVLIAIIGLLYILNLRNSHNWGGDFAMYIMNAQNLVNGTPYAQTGYVYNPDTAYWGNPAYPPVFPLLLAPFVAIWGVNLMMLKLPVILCAVSTLLVLNNKVLPKDLPALSRIIFTIGLGLYPYYFFLTEEILSDLSFLFISYLALYRIDRQIQPDEGNLVRWGTWLVNGVLIYLAYGTRSVGIVLLAVVFFLSIFRLKRISLGAVATIIPALVLIFAQSVLIPEASGGYLTLLPNTMPELIMTLMYAVSYYADYFFALFPFENSWAQTAIFLILVTFFIIGAATRPKKALSSFDLFSIFLLGTLFVFPGYQGIRYLLPILPVYFWYSLEGFEFITRSVKPPWLREGIPLLVLCSLLVYYGNTYANSFPRPMEAIENPKTQEMFQFIRSETTSDDVILFVKPRVMALFTQRKAVVMPVPDPKRDTFAQMREFGVSFLAYRQDRGEEYQPGLLGFIQENPDHFQLIFENSDFQVYEVDY